MERRTYQGGVYERAGPGQPWQLVGQVPAQATVLTNPQQPYDVQKRAAEAASAAAEAPYAGMTAAANAREAEAKASAAEAAVAGRAPMTGKERGDLKGAFDALNNMERGIREIAGLYRTKFKGRDTAGIAAGILPPIAKEDNGLLNDASGRLPAFIAKALELSGQQFNTPREQQLFIQSYLPKSTDTDGQIEAKIAALTDMLNNARASMSTRMGQPFAPVQNPLLAPGGAGAMPQGQEVAAEGQRVWTDQEKQAIRAFASTPGTTPEQLNQFAMQLSGGKIDIPNAAEVIEHFRKTGQVGPVADPVAPKQPEGYAASQAGQGMSGLNEGVATALGLPVDLMNAGLGLGLSGINAVANTDFHAPDKPFMGSDAWRSIMIGAGATLPENPSGEGGFIRRVGQSVGAAAVPVAGTATSLPRAGASLLSAAGGGVGAATANQIAPDNPYAEFAGEMLGSGATGAGLYGLATRNARRAAEAAVPSADDLRQEASDLYKQAESRGVAAGPNVTTNLAGKVRQVAKDEAAITPQGKALPGYDGLDTTLTLLDGYAGQQMSAREIDRVRRVLAANVQSAPDANQKRINKLILNAFDEETLPLAPEFEQARRVASRYLQSDRINEARELAEARAGQYSQSGSENALRTDFRNLDRRIIRGLEQFNPAVEQAVVDTARGTPVSNVFRAVGKFAPRGVVSTGLATGVPFAVGSAIGGPGMGAGFSAGALALGESGRRIAERMTQRSAAMADLLARNGGEITPTPFMDDQIRRQIALQLAAQSSNAGEDFQR